MVFYGADWDNLLPVVLNQNDRREFYHDEQKSSEKVSILDKIKRNVKIDSSKPIVAESVQKE